MIKKPTLHLIANAHLDPVWLWDWREGLNEGIATCRTVLDLMDEFPELTFIRGEAAIYQHIEANDPATFKRIARQVQAGRWEIVGGTWVQPDTNLPATETFLRHFHRGQHYFQDKFNQRVKIAWAADSFGHSAGLPDIFAAAGIDSFACTRPAEAQMHLDSPAFWWEGAGGGRVLTYRPPVAWYGLERDEIPRRLDALLAAAAKDGLNNIGAFYGLGNHGGGPTRRTLLDIREWAARHPEVRVVHSGLRKLFSALRAERIDWPIHRGEMNYCLRGCYASAARFKFAYRKTETAVARAERSDTLIASALKHPPAELNSAWDAVLFNSFHDILPGSSIERAYDDQFASLGHAQHTAQQVEFSALNALASRIDTRVPPVRGDYPTAVPFLVWNPHPQEYSGLVELEACLDYRPLFGYRNRPLEVPVEVRGPTGKCLPFQEITTEHLFFKQDPWRKRVVVPVKLPAFGWNVLTLGWVEGAKPQTGKPVPLNVLPATNSIRLWGNVRLSAITVADTGGSWGDMSEGETDQQKILHRWKITQVEDLECGPLRSVKWVRLEGGASRLDLHITQDHGRDALDFAARVHWNERKARLKLVLSDFGDTAEFEVPGGTVHRSSSGEMPGGTWVKGRYTFASDSLYNFDLHAGSLQATVCRAAHYADSGGNGQPWHPVMDQGELKFRFFVSRRSGQSLETPVIQTVPATQGDLPRSGSLLSIRPLTLKVLAIKPAASGSGLILRIQETTGKACRPSLSWQNRAITLGPVRANEIATWKVTGRTAKRVTVAELT